MSLSPEERMTRARSVRLHVIVALFTLLVLIAVNALFSQPLSMVAVGADGLDAADRRPHGLVDGPIRAQSSLDPRIKRDA